MSLSVSGTRRAIRTAVIGAPEQLRPSQPWIGEVGQRQRLWAIVGLGVWAAAAAAAFRGQTLASTSHPDEARPWLIGAALLGLLGVRLIEWAVPDAEPANSSHPRARPWVIGRRRRIGGSAMMVIGGVYSLAATGLLLWRVPEIAATVLWIMGLAAALLGAAILSYPRFQISWPRPERLASPGLLSLLVVLGVAASLRLPNLAVIPPNVHGDEGAIGLEARRILQGQLPAIFAVGWFDVPALSFFLHAATLRIFGDNLFGLRMASILEALLSTVLLFLLVRRLWGPRPAFLAAAFLAIAAMDIHYSRVGIHYMQASTATLLTLYFLVRGVQERRTLDWLLCGFAIGICFEVYYAARLAPVIVAVYVGYRLLTEPGFLRAHAPGLVALVLGSLVFLAPMGAVFARNPQNFTARTSGVLITTPANLQHELSGYHVSTLSEVIAIQTQRTLEAFNIGGETSLEYGHPAPLFDPWTGGLLAMSAIAILLRAGSPRNVLLASWVWLGLILGSVLTVDAVFSPHLVGVIPALMLAPALTLDRAWSATTRIVGRFGTAAFAVLVIAILGLAGQANVHDYFDVQIVQRQPAGRFTLLAQYARMYNGLYRLYVIGQNDWTLNYETPRFLVPNPDAVDVRDKPLNLPLDHIPSTKGVALLVDRGAADYRERMSAIRTAYPLGREEEVSERPGSPIFSAYLVENADLSAASPGAARD